MTFNFVYDRFQNNAPYPNLAVEMDLSNGYSSLWTTAPYTLPIRLLYYFKYFHYPVQFFNSKESFPCDSFYPIALAYFDFHQDLLSMLPNHIKQAVRNNKLRLLFYYHEADNPKHQKMYLDACCANHKLPLTYKFVSGNSIAKKLKNFVYFPDHESFYWKANWAHSPLPIHLNYRSKDFTALNRVHKWWRATAMTDLFLSDCLNNSYWSYGGVEYSIENNESDFDNNPIEIDTIGIRNEVQNFVKNAPYTCDSLTSDAHNMHHTLVSEHFTNSYFHLVFETFFDIENTGGAFLTEKTFKPIKHGQPFVLVAPAGSLSLLRQLGYKTFDNVIDNSYDDIEDNTQRWQAIRRLIKDLKNENLHHVFMQCREDIIHNQYRFQNCGYERLQQLYKDLNTYHD